MRDSADHFRIKAADDPQDILVLIFDSSIRSWVKAPGSDASRLVYPVFPDPETVPPDYDQVVEDASLDAAVGYSSQHHLISDHHQMVQDLKAAIEQGIKVSLRNQEHPQTCNRYSCISSALATALCLLNRARRIQIERAAMGLGRDKDIIDTFEQEMNFNGRILAVLAGPDAPDQYVSMMNCIFSAQRLGVPIDSCMLAEEKDSTYFQQAARLTNGVYVRPEGFSTSSPDSLMQYLQTVFIVDKQSRDFLAMPTPDKVDFRASCMQTMEIIDNGYTCSICLSTFDLSVGKGAAMCPVCSARFAVINPRKRSSKP